MRQGVSRAQRSAGKHNRQPAVSEVGRGAEGLITFPSFGAAWAIFLAWSMRERKWLFTVSYFLNTAVIVSTLTTGWHYFSDTLAGVGVAVLAIAISAVWASLPLPASSPGPTVGQALPEYPSLSKSGRA